MKPLPVIAITMGDPAGIGPEVVAKSLAHRELPEARYAVLGDAATMRRALGAVGVSAQVHAASNLEDLKFEPRSISVLEPAGVDLTGVQIGEISAAAGKASIEWVLAAADLVGSGQAAAIVTGPIHKEACRLAGYQDIGHMEILQRHANAPLVATMLVAEQLRVVHMSTHKSLAKAVEFCTRENILAKIRLTDEHFKRWGFPAPRIGVAALNPHGSDGGLIGDDEEKRISPAVQDARAEGIDAIGPVPADTIYNQAIAGRYDAVLAMYHDQGHIAIKVFNWAKSISVNLGLPFIRTSVDHGTAFDIAGKGIADPNNMLEAISVAVSLAGEGILPKHEAAKLTVAH
jgi:4-phospho-D-threonate 3-dehydrogenase / 4-phospho-D-erythronate 3-dehydrogenase